MHILHLGSLVHISIVDLLARLMAIPASEEFMGNVKGGEMEVKDYLLHS